MHNINKSIKVKNCIVCGIERAVIVCDNFYDPFCPDCKNRKPTCDSKKKITKFVKDTKKEFKILEQMTEMIYILEYLKELASEKKEIKIVKQLDEFIKKLYEKDFIEIYKDFHIYKVESGWFYGIDLEKEEIDRTNNFKYIKILKNNIDKCYIL